MPRYSNSNSSDVMLGWLRIPARNYIDTEAVFATLITFFVLGILSAVERFIRLHFFPDPKFVNEEKKKTPSIKKLAKK